MDAATVSADTYTRIEVERTCGCCHEKFYLYRSEVRRGRGQFCSHACAMKARMARPLYRDTMATDLPIVTREVILPVKRLKPGPRRR